MKRLCFFGIVLLISSLVFTACSKKTAEEQTILEYDSSSNGNNNENIILSVDNKTLDVKWEDKESILALKDYLRKEIITMTANLYEGFEQGSELPMQLPTIDEQLIAFSGDIMLYSGNRLVLLFKENTWEYTRLGHIENLSPSQISDLLNKENITVQLSLEN